VDLMLENVTADSVDGIVHGLAPRPLFRCVDGNITFGQVDFG
jgi:hypothetical protein